MSREDKRDYPEVGIRGDCMMCNNMRQDHLSEYDLNELRRSLRKIIPKCSPVPKLNKNSTPSEVIDAVGFLEQQGKYNQKMKART